MGFVREWELFTRHSKIGLAAANVSSSVSCSNEDDSTQLHHFYCRTRLVSAASAGDDRGQYHLRSLASIASAGAHFECRDSAVLSCSSSRVDDLSADSSKINRLEVGSDGMDQDGQKSNLKEGPVKERGREVGGWREWSNVDDVGCGFGCWLRKRKAKQGRLGFRVGCFLGAPYSRGGRGTVSVLFRRERMNGTTQ